MLSDANRFITKYNIGYYATIKSGIVHEKRIQDRQTT